MDPNSPNSSFNEAIHSKIHFMDYLSVPEMKSSQNAKSLRSFGGNAATSGGSEWALTRRMIHRGCQVSHSDLRASPADCPL